MLVKLKKEHPFLGMLSLKPLILLGFYSVR